MLVDIGDKRLTSMTTHEDLSLGLLRTKYSACGLWTALELAASRLEAWLSGSTSSHGYSRQPVL